MLQPARQAPGTPLSAWLLRARAGTARTADTDSPINAPTVVAFRRRPRPEQVFGLVFVVGIHIAVLYAMWTYRLLPLPAEAATVFVDFISPSARPETPPPSPKPEAPKPVELEKPLPVTPQPPPPQQLVAEAPILAPSEPVAPAPPAGPPPAPTILAPAQVVAAPTPAAPPKPEGPVNLGNDLSVSCPDRTPPSYPLSARRRGEQGRVVLRVELDERGQIARALVAASSGSMQLDEAALTAVRQWQCNPAQRGGQAVRAVALQPFNFTLEGR